LARRSRPDTSAARRPLSWTGAWQQQLAHTPPRAAMSPSATRPRRSAPARTAVPRPVPPCPGPRPVPRPRALRSRRPSRHPGRPLLRAELRLHQLTGPGELGLGVRRVDRVVAGAEVLEEAVDDLLTGEAG